MGKTKIFSQEMLCFIEGTPLKHKKRNNPLLSKSALKYLACFQLFMVEVRRPLHQCTSI